MLQQTSSKWLQFKKSKFKPTSGGQGACSKIPIKGRKQKCHQSD